jgi:hypothetical protein
MNCAECARLRTQARVRAEADDIAARKLQGRPGLRVDEYTELQAAADESRIDFKPRPVGTGATSATGRVQTAERE